MQTSDVSCCAVKYGAATQKATDCDLTTVKTSNLAGDVSTVGAVLIGSDEDTKFIF
jgi:hypothetical protein